MVDDKPKGSGGTVLKILRWAAFSGCVLLFVRALAKADLASAWGRIEAIGPVAFVVLLPFPCAIAMDSWAWQVFFIALDRKVSWFALFKVRLATEAVTNSAPAGAMWADAISPMLVTRRTGVPVVDVIAAATAKRWTVVRMHSTYVAMSAAFGASTILRVSQSMLHSDALLPIMLGASLFLMLLSIGIEALAARGRVAVRLSALLGKLRFVRVQRWVESSQHHFAHADVQLARLSKNKMAGVHGAWRMLGLWVIESLESFLILRLLGAQLGLIEVFAIDAALSVVRSSAMFAPAGIGVQDVGYLAALQAYGVPDAAAIGPAFIVLKRLKEAVWITVGFVILARSPASRSELLHPEAPAPAPAPATQDGQSLPQEPPAST